MAADHNIYDITIAALTGGVLTPFSQYLINKWKARTKRAENLPKQLLKYERRTEDKLWKKMELLEKTVKFLTNENTSYQRKVDELKRDYIYLFDKYTILKASNKKLSKQVVFLKNRLKTALKAA